MSNRIEEIRRTYQHAGYTSGTVLAIRDLLATVDARDIEIGRLHACEGNSILRATNAEAEVMKAEEEILRRGFQINELTGRAERAEDLIERQTATIRELRERVEKAAAPPAPIPLFLTCPHPKCGARHIDEGEWATRPHHTHSCQVCGLSWRPAVADTVGVRFLPGFKSEPVPEAKPETSPRIMGLMEQIETAEEIKPCPWCRGAGIGLGIYSQAMGLVCGLCKGAKKVRRVLNTKEFGRSPYRWVPVHEDGTPSDPPGETPAERTVRILGLGVRTSVPCYRCAGSGKETCRRKGCEKAVAYKGAEYCGGLCSALRHEPVTPIRSPGPMSDL